MSVMTDGTTPNSSKMPEDLARLEAARRLYAEIMAERAIGASTDSDSNPAASFKLAEPTVNEPKTRAVVRSITEAPSYVSVPNLSTWDWPEVTDHTYFVGASQTAEQPDMPEVIIDLRTQQTPTSTNLWELTGASNGEHPGYPVDDLL